MRDRVIGGNLPPYRFRSDITIAPRHQHQFSAEPLLRLGRRRQHAWRDAQGGEPACKTIRPSPRRSSTWEKWRSPSMRAQGRLLFAAGGVLLFTKDHRKQPTRERFVNLVLNYSKFRNWRTPAFPLSPAGCPPIASLQRGQRHLVVFGGFDSYIEEWLPAALVFRDAGYDVIMFEGARPGSSARVGPPDHEPRVGEAGQSGAGLLQPCAVTLMGFSLGGGLAIRAAAFEPRVRRVIAYDICTDGLECALRPSRRRYARSSLTGSTPGPRARSTISLPTP